ncbi:MAG: Fur family transcriptional regulator, stress-responsive regulator [Thermoleophilaceae bacterium]|jgi:Fur family ferric uptake transcriptional regulator|nr:Fur family transcriptional regulator, stress-responsive regulator [Thermoleophilaceae bacterium]
MSGPDAETKDDTSLLRGAGLRVTATRLAVLAAVRGGDHSAADEIEVAARERLGSISTQAVYDVLAALVGVGLLRRIEPAGGPARFETRVDDNHHHLICRVCSVAVDVDCVGGQAPCLDPDESAGFVVDEAEVIFWGVCPDCRAAAETATPDQQGQPA